MSTITHTDSAVTLQGPADGDLTALRDLVTSRGWQLYRQMVTDEIAGDFEEHITKALDVPDAAMALDRMRQIAAVRKAGLRWLRLPQQRIDALKAKDRREDALASPSRRPLGL